MLALILSLFMSTQATPPAVTTIANVQMSNVERPQQSVARTQAEWAALWKLHAGDKPLPKVDFDKSTVVAVFLGTRMTAGFSVAIVGTHADGDALVVEFEEKRPGRDSITAQVITTPAAIAAIPKFAGEIRFEKKN